jgi:O-antigen/teichoic acid export membrane protein
VSDGAQRLEAPPPSERELSSAEVKDKAVRGVLTVGLRGIAIRGLGLLGNVALARLLAPEQFGLIAFGFTVVVLGNFVINGGIAAQVIRRPTPPTHEEWQAVFGLQLAVALALSVLITLIGLPLGQSGVIAAIMAWSLPIDAARAPAALGAERRLDYVALVPSEVLEILAYNVAAICAVALGAGVWGVAAAVVLRALVGTTIVVTRLPPGLVRPRWSWTTVQPLLRFGVAFQGIALVNIVRDQGLVVVTGAVAGWAALGYWTIAYRMVQVILLVLDSLWRVSYPAVARLLATGEDLGPPVQRALRTGAIVIGLIVASLIGSAPALLPLLFGERWAPAVPAIAFAAAGLMVSGPIATACAGLLLACGRVTGVLRATVIHTATWFAVATPLMPALGVTAVGIGWCVAACVDGALLARYAKQQVALPVFAALARPVAATAIAAGSGWWLAHTVTEPFFGSVAALAVAASLYLGILRLLAPRELLDTYTMLRRGLRRAGEPEIGSL